jgi:hypothetical protein
MHNNMNEGEQNKKTLKEVMGGQHPDLSRYEEIERNRKALDWAVNTFVKETEKRLEDNNFWRGMSEVAEWAMQALHEARNNDEFMALEHLVGDIGTVHTRRLSTENLPDKVRQIIDKALTEWTRS